MNLQDTMMLFGGTLGSRHTKRERYLFGQELRKILEANSWDYSLQLPEKSRRFIRVENIIVGDLQRCKTLFVVPFDTPTKSLLPCRYYPFHPELTIKDGQRDLLMRGLLGFFLILMAVPLIWLAFAYRGWWRFLLIPATMLSVFAFFLMKGRRNPFNFNRSSASVAVAVRLCEELAGNKNVAFAFCDKAATSYEGYKLLSKELSPNLAVVLLDCIAKGDQLVLAHGTMANLKAKRLLEYLPNSTMERTYEDSQVGRNLLSLFPAGMILTSGAIEDGELVVHNTRSPKDVGLDLPRLELIEAALCAFAQGK